MFPFIFKTIRSTFTIKVAIFVAIVSFALFFRLNGLNWDNNTLFHPDERAFLNQVHNIKFPQGSEWKGLLDAETSVLHPGSFNWGSFPHYVLKTAQYLISPFKWLDLYELRFRGRIIMALSDLVTIGFIYLICKENFSRRIGVLAVIFASLAVIHIQLSHFFTVDVLMTTMSTGTIYFCLRIARYGKVRDSILAGVFFGLAIATKFSAVPLVLPIIYSHIISGGFTGNDRLSDYVGILKRLIGFGVFSLLALVLTQPYMFLDFGKYVADISTQSSMVRMNVDWPFTRQYINTTKYWYQISQLTKWGLGPILGALCWIGFIHLLLDSVRRKLQHEIILILSIVPYLLLTGWFDVKFMRYMLPITPFLLIGGSRTLFIMYEKIIRTRKILGFILIGFVLLFTLHYSLAFLNVYSGHHPSKQASDWLSVNSEQGDIIAQEHWDEGIPHVKGLKLQDRLEMYEPDSVRKFSKITRQLEQADFLILVTNRLYATIPRLEERYPISTNYYRLLFEGKLGYELVFHAQRQPSFLGITYFEDPFARVDIEKPDGFKYPSGFLIDWLGWADESFNVYDHPQVMIFKNEANFKNHELMELINVGALNKELMKSEKQTGLQFSHDQFKRQRSGGTWNDLFYLSDSLQKYSVVFWYLILQIIGLVALPFTLRIFWRIPDKGYLVSKIVGLVLISVLTWIVVNLGIIHYGITAILISLCLLILLSVGIAFQKYKDMYKWLKSNVKRLFLWEIILLGSFLFMIILRSYNPDLWHPFRGGEKPMDFAYLNAVIKSSIFPPYDPWYSGGYLNYYYFGQFMVSNLIRLSGVVPSVGYNLAVATFFSLTAVSVFSLISNLVYLTIRSQGRLLWRSWIPWGIGIFGIFLVLISGNIDGLYQVISGIREYFQNGIIVDFDFWRSSRMMSPNSQGFEITEFPFFTFLFSDLHAHMMVIPIVVTTYLLGTVYFLGIGKSGSTLTKVLQIILLGIFFGVIRVTNTWDYPTSVFFLALILCGGELFFGYGHPIKRVCRGLVVVTVVNVTSYIVFLPFHMNFELFNNGLEFSSYRTELWRFSGIHFLFLFVIFTWIIIKAQNYIYLKALTGNFDNMSTKRFNIFRGAHFHVTFGFLLLVTTIFIPFSWSTFLFILILGSFISFMFVIEYIYNVGTSRYLFVFVVMALTGLSLLAGVELLTVKGDIGRMNTVFKFYLQAWTLLSISSTYFLWDIFRTHNIFNRLIRNIWVSVFCIVVIAALIYPALSIPVRSKDRFNPIPLTLDGSKYMETAKCSINCYKSQEKPFSINNDLKAIKWLQNNVSGSPVIVEGVTDLYMWGNRISVYTGLPAVIGWDWHQRQQRVGYAREVTQRGIEVEKFYSTPAIDTALSFLDKYDVKYVVVGDLERGIYPGIGIRKFDRMNIFGLRQVYPAVDQPHDEFSTKIYEYVQ